MMGCFIGCLALITPRFAIFLVFLFSDYLGRAYETNFWPFLGFLFMPLTTLAYAFAVNAGGGVHGMYLVLMVVAVLADLGLLGGAKRSTRSELG